MRATAPAYSGIQEELIFRPGIETELHAGMIVGHKPIMENYWYVQDQILITETDAEVLWAGIDTANTPSSNRVIC